MLAESLLEVGPPMIHVFVDGENVHHIDPALLPGRPFSFTLMLGKLTKVDAGVLEKLMARAASVHLIRLTSAARNALDFALAYYVGRAVLADPTAIVHVISRDKGFDPLMEHLRSRNIDARRHDNFSALAGPPARAATPTGAPAPAATKLAKPTKALRDRVTAHLLDRGSSRPRTLKTLISHLLNSGFRGLEPQLNAVIDQLCVEEKLIIGGSGRITYRLDEDIDIPF